MLSKLLRSPWGGLRGRGDLDNTKTLYYKICMVCLSAAGVPQLSLKGVPSVAWCVFPLQAFP